MEVRNLVGRYLKEILSGNEDINRYVQSFPALFEHYFTFWSERDLPFVGDSRKIRYAQRLILVRLPEIEDRLKRASFPTANLRLVLFVGQNVSNGHAALLDDVWWVWIPVEAYASSPQVNTFVTHELIHGLQYAASPELFFTSKEEKNRVSRLVMTEGVATFAGMKVLHTSEREALWADLLNDEEYVRWQEQYVQREEDIIAYVLENWDADAKWLFEAREPGNMMQYRAGYKTALDAVQSVAGDFGGLPSLIRVAPAELERHLKLALKRKRDELVSSRA